MPQRRDDYAGYGFFTQLLVAPSGALIYSNYRYDRLDVNEGALTHPDQAVRPRSHNTTTPGNIFGWIEIGHL